MATIYLNISIVTFALSGILFVIAIVLGIKFDIPKIIGDLSGITAKKNIEKLRNENEKSGIKSFRPSPVNSKRGKITEVITSVGRMGERVKVSKRLDKANSINKIDVTEKLTVYQNERTELLNQEEGTALLNQEEGTALLNQEEGTALLEQEEGTALLEQEKRTVYERTDELTTLQMFEDILMVHTKDIIK